MEYFDGGVDVFFYFFVLYFVFQGFLDFFDVWDNVSLWVFVFFDICFDGFQNVDLMELVSYIFGIQEYFQYILIVIVIVFF